MILIAVISLGAIGAVGAVFLYAASKKFEVYEDPRIAQVQEVLPGANCGGCGYPGCAGFAGACVKADSLDGLLCPVGGGPVMAKVATILGKNSMILFGQAFTQAPQEVHFSSSTSAIPVAGLMWIASKAQAFTQSP